MTNQTWVVELTFATREPLHTDTLLALDENGDPHDWYVSRRAGGSGIVVSAYETADDPTALSQWTAERAGKWLADHDVHGDLIEARVVTEEQRDAEAEAPTMPALVSASGAAEILDITRQRVHQLYRENSRFPAPLVQLATGPVWDEKAIEWFNSVWERKAGRPTNTAKTNQNKAKSSVKTSGNVRSLGSYRVNKATTKKPRQAAAKSTRKPANG